MKQWLTKTQFYGFQHKEVQTETGSVMVYMEGALLTIKELCERIFALSALKTENKNSDCCFAIAQRYLEQFASARERTAFLSYLETRPDLWCQDGCHQAV